EDCTVLTGCLNKCADRQTALSNYETMRKEHLDVLADLCIENFIEMRDRVGSRLFLVRKKFGLLLHRLFPRWYVPLYVMIEFTRIPYANALRRARRQDWAVRGILVVLFFALIILGVLLWR